MTTIDDKLKLFTKIVIDKVQQESENKIIYFTEESDKVLLEEKHKIEEQAGIIIKQSKKKAEAKKSQIISKANMERQHTILKKKQQIFDTVISELKNRALAFTDEKEYYNYLNDSIRKAIYKINTSNINIYIKKKDIDRFLEQIKSSLASLELQYNIKEASDDILGGCIIENQSKTIRVDASMLSIIEENKELIGRELVDNLQ